MESFQGGQGSFLARLGNLFREVREVREAF